MFHLPVVLLTQKRTISSVLEDLCTCSCPEFANYNYG